MKLSRNTAELVNKTKDKEQIDFVGDGHEFVPLLFIPSIADYINVHRHKRASYCV